eukprot:8777556-Alexandrium_andersonii.AAC.1
MGQAIGALRRELQQGPLRHSEYLPQVLAWLLALDLEQDGHVFPSAGRVGHAVRVMTVKRSRVARTLSSTITALAPQRA